MGMIWNYVRIPDTHARILPLDILFLGSVYNDTPSLPDRWIRQDDPDIHPEGKLAFVRLP
jgi:hypothetical protein